MDAYEIVALLMRRFEEAKEAEARENDHRSLDDTKVDHEWLRRSAVLFARRLQLQQLLKEITGVEPL